MSRAFRVLIHIGTEKTGTTTLQNRLVQNRDLLEDKGIYYLTTPQRIEARGLVASALGDQQPDEFLTEAGVDTPEKRQLFREATWQQVHATLCELPQHVHTVIVSSEHFHSRLRQQEHVAWVKRLFSDYAKEFRVICYLRQQSELVESFYSTALKNGSTRSLDELAERLCKKTNHYYNYKMLLNLWGKVFGNGYVVPRIFDRSTLVEGDVVKDFLVISGIDVALKRPRRQRVRYNESLSPLGQELLRGLNAFQYESGEGKGGSSRKNSYGEEEVNDLRSDIIKAFPGAGQKVNGKVFRHIKSEFMESNRHVQQQWFSSRPESLFLFSRTEKAVVEQNVPVTSEQLEVIRRVVDFLSDGSRNPVKPINGCADILKKVAVYYESSDIELSYALMGIALRIRPRGPFIKRKFGEYLEVRQRPFYRLKKWVRR